MISPTFPGNSMDDTLSRAVTPDSPEPEYRSSIRTDGGQLWSFIRDVLTRGGVLERSSQGLPYEQYSAKLDGEARKYAVKLRELLDSQPSPSPSSTLP